MGAREAWMRIATWNVNSLKARLEKIMWWLERAKPDVHLMRQNGRTPPSSSRQAPPTSLFTQDLQHVSFADHG